ncbi:hypothetical protein [Massilia sp. KIM]|uniref:hypothetical protein n=1 Tax=Massilia sp. KIM TaxID=1955422 RepID=UPI00117E8CB7|nr:hypothetical protein [Massilia sp. KIM]
MDMTSFSVDSFQRDAKTGTTISPGLLKPDVRRIRLIEPVRYAGGGTGLVINVYGVQQTATSNIDSEVDEGSGFVSEAALRRNKISVDAQVKFAEIAKSEHFEYGYTPPSERYLSSFAKEYPELLGNVVQSIYLKMAGEPTVVVALLNAIGAMSYDSVKPFGQITAVAAVTNPSVEVKEAAIRVYEAWGHPEGISILRDIECPWPWLDRYRNQVIQDLGGA